MVYAQLWGVETLFLLDSGSCASIIDKKLFDQILEVVDVPLLPYDTEILGASGEKVNILGQFDAKLNFSVLPSKEFNGPILVAEAPDLCVLGIDFLTHIGASLDLAHRLLRLPGACVPMVFNKPDVNFQCCRVFAGESVTLPPRSEVVLQGRLKARGRKRPSEGLVEGINRSLETLDELRPLVARSMVSPSGNAVPVRLMNVHPEPIVLLKGQCIALLQPVDSELEPEERDGQPVLHSALQQLYDKSLGELNETQAEALHGLLLQNQEVFSKGDLDIGKTDLVKHTIPFREPIRRLPLHKYAEAQKCVQDMLKQGVIEPSSSPWRSGVVLVKKKDGGTRFCIDFRKLNSHTKFDSYPLPNISDNIEALKGACWFSTLDLTSAYWSCLMDPLSASKTAFSVGRYGLYQFTRMPFGLCGGASSTFERLMELVLSGLQWETVIIYLDDVIVFSNSFERHIEDLQEVFTRLKKAGLKLKCKKCLLFRKEVLYLGHVVGEFGVKTDPEKTRKVKEWPRPCNVQQLRSFLGLCAYYRRFVRSFGEISAPLHALTKKGVEWVWTADCETAFKILKEKLCSTPVLAYPDPNREFILDTDASGHSISGVLGQVGEDGKEHVIAYGSRVLSKAERNYSVTRREMLAVMYFVKHFRHYLLGKEFLLRTDHGSLRWLFNFKNPEGQVARWLEYLSMFKFRIEHRPGHKHVNADSLSRIPLSEQDEDTRDFGTVMFVNNGHFSNIPFSRGEAEAPIKGSTGQGRLRCLVTLEDVKDDDLVTHQKDDRDLKIVREWLLAGERPPRADLLKLSFSLRHWWSVFAQLELRNDIIYYRWEHNHMDGYELKAVLPESMKLDIFRLAHSNIAAGHFATGKTVRRIRQTYYFPGIDGFVKRQIKKCRRCERRGNAVPRRRAPLQGMAVCRPLDRVGMDFVGQFPESEGNRVILVVQDYFTKWVELYALPSQEAPVLARALVDNFITRFGIPWSWHSDKGPNFESNLINEVSKILGVVKTRTTSYHPQCDGLAERFMRTLQSVLAKFVDEHQRDWASYLPMVQFAYNSSVQESTGYTPAKLMFGREMVTPLSFVAGRTPDVAEDDGPETFAEKLEDRMQVAFEEVEVNLGLAHKRQKKLYDRRLHGDGFRVGDKVWLHSPVVKRGLSRKLVLPWTGPYVVEKKLSEVNYKIRSEDGRKSHVVHFDRLKPCLSDPERRDSTNVELGVDRPVPLSPAAEPVDANETVWLDNDLVDDDVEDVAPPASPPGVVTSRRGRPVQVPFRFRDYIMS